MNYPPFTKLVGIGIESRSENRGQVFAKKVQDLLNGKIAANKNIELLGPSPAALYRLNEKFRWCLILRSKDRRALLSFIRECAEIESLKQSAAGTVKLSIDVDPVNLL